MALQTELEIENVARALCREHGLDPDEPITMNVPQPTPVSEEGVLLMVHRPPVEVTAAAWERFGGRALNAIIDHRAVQSALCAPVNCPFTDGESTSEPPKFACRYQLMTTEQAPPEVVASWVSEPLFAAYVQKRRSSQT